MDEVTGILIACTAYVLGILFLGWVYGDFNKPKAPPQTSETPAPGSK